MVFATNMISAEQIVHIVVTFGFCRRKRRLYAANEAGGQVIILLLLIEGREEG